jgi:hypothetical protein
MYRFSRPLFSREVDGLASSLGQGSLPERSVTSSTSLDGLMISRELLKSTEDFFESPSVIDE